MASSNQRPCMYIIECVRNFDVRCWTLDAINVQSSSCERVMAEVTHLLWNSSDLDSDTTYTILCSRPAARVALFGPMSSQSVKKMVQSSLYYIQVTQVPKLKRCDVVNVNAHIQRNAQSIISQLSAQLLWNASHCYPRTPNIPSGSAAIVKCFRQVCPISSPSKGHGI